MERSVPPDRTWHVSCAELNHQRDALLERARRSPGRVIRLDCTAVENLTSQGMANLVALGNALAQTGGMLQLTNVIPSIGQILRLTGIHTIMALLVDHGGGPADSLPTPV